MRAAFIFAGGAFLQRFHWAIYVFGGILALTGLKLLFQRHQELHPERNPLVKGFQKLFPVTTEPAGDRFMVLKNGKRYATPLPRLAEEVETLAACVDEHLKKMGFVWL